MGKAFTVGEFCERNRMCAATYYNIQRRGCGPRFMKVGSRTLITPEAEADWRREMEAENAGVAQMIARDTAHAA